MAEITLTSQNFENEVLNSNLPVLIDFWATWCGPCRMIAPIVEEFDLKYEGKVKVGKINVDDEPALASQFGIVSIPTLIVIKDGKIAETSIGLCDMQKLERLLGF